MSAATLVRMGADSASAEPALVLVAHGSRAAGGDDVATTVAAAVSARRPEQLVRLAYLNHGCPSLPAALDALAAEGRSAAVVVPLLLSTGVHATTDIDLAVASATAAHPGLAVKASGALGPDRLLVAALRERLDDAGAHAGGGGVVILAATGSSDPAGLSAVNRTAEMLQAVAGYDAVTVGFVGGAEPDLAEALANARAGGASAVFMVPYLLGDGHFAGVARAMAGDDAVVTAPLGAHDGVIDLVLVRYDDTAAALA